MTFKLKFGNFREEVTGFGCLKQKGTVFDDPG